MKKIKYLIIIMAVIIIITLLAIFIASSDEATKQGIAESKQYNKTTEESIEYANKRATLHDVDNTQDFFIAVNCANQYFNAINQSSWSTQDSMNNEEIKQAYLRNAYNLLSTKYIKENNITEKNVLSYVNEIKETTFFIPLKMKQIVSTDNSTKKYIIYGIEENMQNEYLEDIYVIVNIDETNGTFSIEPQLDNYNSIDEISLDSEPITIEKNDNNQLVEISVTDEYVSKQYVDYYKKLALGRPDIAYELLDKEYREKRFGSLDAYKQYLRENETEVKTIVAKQYLVDRSNEDFTQYVGKDKYGYLYVFNIITPTNYTIQLDTYTISTASFKKQYENGDEQTKVQMNLNKFVLMLNNQDWESAYNLLDEGFKNNYFKTVEDFKNYAKTFTYRYNNMKVKSFDVVGNIYTCEVELTDLTEGEYIDESKGDAGSGQVYEWEFYIQLGENEEFTISFDVSDKVF